MKRCLALAAGLVVVAGALGGCGPSKREQARELAVENLSAEYARALHCIRSELDDVGAASDVTISLSDCVETRYADGDPAQLEGARSDDDTWLASVRQVGDRRQLEFASATYGQTNGVTGATRWAVVCWLLEVDLTQGHAEAPIDVPCGAVAEALCPPTSKEYLTLSDLEVSRDS